MSDKQMAFSYGDPGEDSALQTHRRSIRLVLRASKRRRPVVVFIRLGGKKKPRPAPIRRIASAAG